MVDGDSLENYRFESSRGFESLSLLNGKPTQMAMGPVSKTGEDKTLESSTLSLAAMKTCSFKPPTFGYAPCTRAADHRGPCAHDFTFLGKVFEWLKTLLNT